MTAGSTTRPQNMSPVPYVPANAVPAYPTLASSPPGRRDLRSWWRGFKLPKHNERHESLAPGIFGVPLRQSIKYANVAISLIDENGESYIYGYVPIVVAKCGVFLKEKATHVEGIFRLSGSEKRIKELKTIFDSPDRYGKGLVWNGFTVHDAANVLRRYLNDLPEPVVPLDLYEKFRHPLRGATRHAVGDAEGPQFVDQFDEQAAISQYKSLITQLPPLNRQLLLYILDLLAVFAAKSDENRMTSQNLAAIFQPGMLSHPQHAMAPEEYRLNQCVIIFLIEHQDCFLIGMSGTAADEKTKQEVESGTTTPMANCQSAAVGAPGLGRSASTASAAAESVKRDGTVRRTSSHRSGNGTGTTTPSSPVTVTTPTAGLSRSNTVPHRRSVSLQKSPAFKPDMAVKAGDRNMATANPLSLDATAKGDSKIAAVVTSTAISTPAVQSATLDEARGQERLSEPAEVAPVREKLSNLFTRSSTAESEQRQPNKLKKKKAPDGFPSAQSSDVSLPFPTGTSLTFENSVP